MTTIEKLRAFLVGKPRDTKNKEVFHKISLIAFFAWVGLGADGLSSSCYGPSEAFMTLGSHHFLGILIALATAGTIFIIAESYFQIIELFPSGGGGYIVATHLLNPTVGMISGCALLIDYVLTITISVASGADAMFSFLPSSFYLYKIWFAVFILLVLLFLNLRGIKESILPLVPIFLAFVFTHVFVIVYSFVVHFMNFSTLAAQTAHEVKVTTTEIGIFGVIVLLLRAYSMGAGTYTGIEAVSNGIPMLKEPKAKTARRTMTYMVISLATVVFGLMVSYVFYKIEPVTGKTLNAILFDNITLGWGNTGYIFVLITLLSEAAILFVAAQTGFLDGPRVLSNMAFDRWVPKRFALLSDRLVTQNGILIMGIAALILMLASNGSVGFLVVLYSINVFITFTLSQLGMVRHWWGERKKVKHWKRKIGINGIGLVLTTFILVSVTTIKFHDGGWITILITGTLVCIALLIKKTYTDSDRAIKKLDKIVAKVEASNVGEYIPVAPSEIAFDQNEKTAVIIVKDFTGVGIETILSIFKSFGTTFNNYIFVQVGLISAGVFKDSEEYDRVKSKVKSEVDRYIDLIKKHGYYSEGYCLSGIDTVDELAAVAPEILQRFPHAVFFGGQVVFPDTSLMSRMLHNYTLFSMQRRLYTEGIALFILPVEVKK